MTALKEKKERLCDQFYNWIVRDMRAHANGVNGTNAWVISWHLREEWGWSTAQINYHLNKLVKEGKMIKKTSTYWTKFSPVELDGFFRDGENFTHNKYKPTT